MITPKKASNNDSSPLKFGMPLPDIDDLLSTPKNSPTKNMTGEIPTLPRSGAILRISGDTLVKMIRGEYDDCFTNLYIIDCRYFYEYLGGHIKNAMNLHTIEELYEMFFLDPIPDSIIVFHCEFSHNRGPQIANLFRNHDRVLNRDKYPDLFYPSIYVLDGGYKNFYSNFPEMCEGNYVTMLDEAYRADLIECTKKFRALVDADSQFDFVNERTPSDSSHTFLMSPNSNVRSPLVTKMLYMLSSP